MARLVPSCKAGQGQMVDVALYESVFNLMESLVPEYDVAGVVRERTGGALPGIVPSNTYTRRKVTIWSSPVTAMQFSSPDAGNRSGGSGA
jgi:crotonobetainyl-CoA:carnitine CoA-transferase CaiB-like acyl-CoA transferase